MERYVIHIHQRDPKDPTKVSGTVEGVGGKGKIGFVTPNELWKILSSPSGSSSDEKPPKKRKSQDEYMSFTEIMEGIREEMEREEEKNGS